MEEIYSILRRRPDGKSLGFVHDCMWQAAALMLATRPLSQGEFEVIEATGAFLPDVRDGAKLP